MSAARRLLVAGSALLVAACGGSRTTPRAAFDAVRAAAAAGDGPALFAAHDTDTREHRKQRIREWRALLARGDAPETVLAGTGIAAEDVVAGTVYEAAIRIFSKHSAMIREAAWFASADVFEETRETADAAKLRLRGADGTERAIWFLRERGGWTLDYYRTSMPR